MKHRSLSQWILGATTVLALTAAQLQSVASELAADAPGKAAPSAEGTPSTNAISSATAPAADTDAPVTPVAMEKPLPSNIRPSGPVAEVIKLANSGLTEAVMLAYVTNSQHTFNLSAEDIIYLNDIGVPGSVVTAMIQQDQALKTSLAAAAAGPPAALPEPQAGSAPGTEPIPDQGIAPPADSAPPYAVEAPLAPPEEPTVPMFYDSLAPYGNWVDVQGYGRCWQPSVGVINTGWQPYFDCGHWIYSDCGWYWLSDYSWGWAPFHYGTWFRHARLGWCWVPGRVWGPSWVCWRYNNDFCGWAPLPPGAGFTAGIGLTFHGHGVWDRDDFGLRPFHYHFVAWNHFNDRHLRPHRLPAHETGRAFATSTVGTRIIGDGHTVINNGLPPSRVVAATHRPIHTVALREMSNASAGGGRAEHFEAGGQALAVYRPNPALATTRTSRGTLAGAGGSAPRLDSNPTPWMPRSGSSRQSVTELRQDNPPADSTPPLILRGQQPSALRESRPANSLVVIGRGNSAPAARPAQPWSPAPSADRATPAASAPIAQSSRPGAEEAPRVPTRNAAPNGQLPQRNWMGMVSSSPQPSWFNRNEAVPTRPPDAGVAARPETRTYQAAPRPSSAEVPRYAPAPAYAPAYTPQRSPAPSWSAPARSPSFESRPAPPAAPAPSAPPAARSSPPQQSGSGRNGR